MVKPPCYNRPPAAEGQWYLERFRFNAADTRRIELGLAPWGPPVKPVYRWYPRWFEDRCAAHDGTGIGPNNETYPEANGWDCRGCRWCPPRVARKQELDYHLTELRARAAQIQFDLGPDDWVAKAYERFFKLPGWHALTPYETYSTLVMTEAGLEQHIVPVDQLFDVVPDVRTEMRDRVVDFAARHGGTPVATDTGYAVVPVDKPVGKSRVIHMKARRQGLTFKSRNTTPAFAVGGITEFPNEVYQ